VSWLELVQKLPLLLDADEIGRVERALCVSMVWARHEKTLQELYPWLTERVLAAFGWSRRAYLDAIHAAIGLGTPALPGVALTGSPGWRAWREQTLVAIAQRDPAQLPWSPHWILGEPLAKATSDLLDAWHAAFEPLEAIREDASLVAASGYRLLFEVKEEQKATSRTRVRSDGLRRFLTYAWQRRRAWASAAVNDASARRKLLDGFARYARVAANEAPRTPSGALAYEPGLANAPPLPCSLATSPPVSAPLFMVPVGAEIRANMLLPFPDVYEAFGSFEYRWELVKIPAQTIDAAIERGSDLGFATTDEAAPGLGSVIANQLDRRYGYAEEDVRRVFQACDGWLGPAGVGAAMLVGVGAIAGFVGEVITSFVEQLTAKRDEKRIALREPGLFLLRCIAIPELSEDADRIRPPSAAYLPLWVRSTEEVANATLLAREQARTRLSRQIAQLREALARTSGPRERAARQQTIEELEIELRGSVDEVLEHAYRTLNDHIATATIPKSPPWLARQTEEALQRAVLQRDEWLALLVRRATWRSELGPYAPRPEMMVRIRGVLVTDDGAVIDLLADAFRHPITGAYHVFDSTKPHGGHASARAGDPSLAIRIALASLLDRSTTGYGRGHVSFSVTIDGRTYHQEFRTSPDLPSALVHSLDHTVQLATAIALLAVAASGGAVGLGALLPLAVLGGVPAGYRLVEKASEDQLGLDLETLLDIVNVVGSVAGLGQKVAGALRPRRRARAGARGGSARGGGARTPQRGRRGAAARGHGRAGRGCGSGRAGRRRQRVIRILRVTAHRASERAGPSNHRPHA
jgi:hypothetical protein